MKEKGLSSTSDIIMSSLVVSLACFVLIEGVGAEIEQDKRIAKKRCKNTLLILQKVPAKRIQTMNYRPRYSIIPISERKLEEKSITQMISEDVILSLEYPKSDDRDKLSHNFKEKLKSVIKKCLDKVIGHRFSYKFSATLKRKVKSRKRSRKYRLTIDSLKESSKIVCKENISLSISVPSSWNGSKNQKIENKLAEEMFLNSEFKEIYSQILEFPPIREETRKISISLELWTP